MSAKYKICMVGAFAVGKTSLVKRFVESIFSEKYLTTVGVKVDKKSVRLGDREVDLLLWDIAGEDDTQPLQLVYLRGAAGYLLVADGTRSSTLDKALVLQKNIEKTIGEKPFLVTLNKSDLTEEWDIPEGRIDELRKAGWETLKTSAKTGVGVEEAFLMLAEKILEK